MAKAEKWFKTRDELMTFISKTDLLGADVLGLCVRYDDGKTKDEVQGCVGCALPTQNKIADEEVELPEIPSESELDSARAKYSAKFDKKVPNNKKNDIEWLERQVEEK